MAKSKPKTELNKCGLVMPISAIDGCNEQHWKDVKEIISNAVENAGFVPNLVSYADDVGIIQKRIIQNLYENPVVVCDVSGKNPNVMFELGLRLAFDKPTIIIKDDNTSYSFDTSPIEHLEYPRDLRFNKIVDFKKALSEKIKATYDKSIKDPGYTTFLKHFGTFTAAKIDTKEVSKEDFIIEELKELKKSVDRQEVLRRNETVHYRYNDLDNDKLIFCKNDYNNFYKKSYDQFACHFNDKLTDKLSKKKFVNYLLSNKELYKPIDDEESLIKALNDFVAEEKLIG